MSTEPGKVYEDDDYIVTCQLLKASDSGRHGYRVTEKDRTGHFDVKRAAALGISARPANMATSSGAKS